MQEAYLELARVHLLIDGLDNDILVHVLVDGRDNNIQCLTASDAGGVIGAGQGPSTREWT